MNRFLGWQGVSRRRCWATRMRFGHLCALAATPVTPYAASERSCDVQSYVQMNTGALIRPACSSTNPGIQRVALPLPKDHLPRGRHWSRGSNASGATLESKQSEVCADFYNLSKKKRIPFECIKLKSEVSSCRRTAWRFRETTEHMCQV